MLSGTVAPTQPQTYIRSTPRHRDSHIVGCRRFSRARVDCVRHITDTASSPRDGVWTGSTIRLGRNGRIYVRHYANPGKSDRHPRFYRRPRWSDRVVATAPPLVIQPEARSSTRRTASAWKFAADRSPKSGFGKRDTCRVRLRRLERLRVSGRWSSLGPRCDQDVT